MYTREEFEIKCKEWREEMKKDETLHDQATVLLSAADQYNWIHQTRWQGEPCLQTPEDLLAMANIVYKYEIDVVVELGSAWCGTALFLSHIGIEVAAIDIYIPDDLRKRIIEKDTLSNITLIDGDSMVVDYPFHPMARSMVILDSNHTRDHVLRELEAYAPKAKYMVVCDTIIEEIPVQLHRPRPWGPGNSPKTALDEFLRHHDEWEIDPDVNLLMSCNSYVRRK